MELIAIDKYLDLPREQAYNRYLDEKNFKTLRIYALIILIIHSIGILAATISYGLTILTGIFLLNIGALFYIRINYQKLFSPGNIRRVSYFFLLAQLVIAMLLTLASLSIKDSSESSVVPNIQSEQTQSGKNKLNINVDEADSFTEYIFMFGLSILFFRFSRSELIQLFIIAFTIPVILEFFVNGSITLGDDVPNIALSLIFFLIAFTSDKRRRKKFTGQYDFYARKNVENIRMRRELNHAREIQLSMLPRSNIKIDDIHISAVSNPATEVGGDYFDYFRIPGNKVGFFICDVSGHGVASGLLLSGLRSCMHLVLEDISDPKEVLEKLNRMIRKTQNKKMFVTAIFAMIDMKENRCTLFNAGHMPPYRISGESGEIFRIRKHGLALGIMDSIESGEMKGEVSFEFNKGDKLILYTDGVNEAENPGKEEYGLDRMEIFLNENSLKEPENLLNNFIADIKKFTGDFPQKDDLTVLIVHRT